MLNDDAMLSFFYLSFIFWMFVLRDNISRFKLISSQNRLALIPRRSLHTLLERASGKYICFVRRPFTSIQRNIYLE